MFPFFTIPDYKLSQETSVDPMGLQVIWTELGQKIFNDKLTTVSNDMRVFTINLFHHHLINKVFTEHLYGIYNNGKEYRTWITDYDIKAGLVIFLEDIYTHVMYRARDGQNEADTFGVLGIVKLRGLINAEKPDGLKLEANKTKGILSRQIQLGMTGRYKGPMMQMGFFNRSLVYDINSMEEISGLFQSWPEALQLRESLTTLITEYLLQSGNKDYPLLKLEDIKKNQIWKKVTNGYLNCFGKREIHEKISRFWKARMGLTSHAANAIYEQFPVKDDFDFNDCRKIFEKAANRLKIEPVEKDKIQTIILIEPFLSHTEFAFRYLAQLKTTNLENENENIEGLRVKILESARFNANKVSNPRLADLQKIMTAEGTNEQWVKGVLDFHRKIMEKRGGSVWLDLTSNNTFRHHYAPELSSSFDTVDKYLEKEPWLHHYYLQTIQLIHSMLH